MGLLDGMTKGLLGKFLGGGSSQNPLMDIVLGQITNPQIGGLQGLIQKFKRKGLGDVVSSWISIGQNRPVPGVQIQHALSGNFIQQIAKQLGARNRRYRMAWRICSLRLSIGLLRTGVFQKAFNSIRSWSYSKRIFLKI